MNADTTGHPSTRDRILAAATELFYAQGIRATSADRIIEVVGTTKVTFYRHFRTKGDLVVAYLQLQAAAEREWMESARQAGDPVASLRALATGIGAASCSPGFRGCPFINAAAVVWQLRTEGPAQASRVPEVVNVVVSILAAVALAVTPSAGALVVWGVWALVSGAVQLLTALLRRKLGGQIPLIVSGAISVFAGVAFAAQGAQGAAISAGVGAYALLGGVFFLVAAIRLSVLLRRAS